MIENPCSLDPDCTMGIPATTSGGGPSARWWWPLTIASTLPCTASATPWISLPGGRGPAWAQITTTVAPCARKASASCAATGPPSTKSRPATIPGAVVSGVSRVARPITPTFTPPAWTSALGRSQSGRFRVPFRKTFAASTG